MDLDVTVVPKIMGDPKKAKNFGAKIQRAVALGIRLAADDMGIDESVLSAKVMVFVLDQRIGEQKKKKKKEQDSPPAPVEAEKAVAEEAASE